MRAVARLVLTTADTDRVLYLRRGRALIGRQGDCDLIIPRSDISRRHALVEIIEHSACIIDQGSRNGTRVDGVTVARADLAHGAVIHLGLTPCIFEWLDGGELSGDEPTPACPAGSGSNPGLTPAQRKVLVYLTDGLSEKEVAAKLSLSRNTVHNHVKQIYLTFGVNSRAELLAQILRGGAEL